MSCVFCCEECGHLHSSQYTALDSYCPRCLAERSLQAIVTCVGCSMPVTMGDDAYLVCDQKHAGIIGPQPVIGLWAKVSGMGFGRVTSIGIDSCVITLSSGKSIRTRMLKKGSRKGSFCFTPTGGGKRSFVKFIQSRKETESLLSTAPPDEECVQSTDDNFDHLAKAEGQRYIDLLKTVMGDPPKGVNMRVRRRPHDLGHYYEVEVEWDADDPVGMAYAMSCVDDGPLKWTDTEPFDWRTARGV